MQAFVNLGLGSFPKIPELRKRDLRTCMFASERLSTAEADNPQKSLSSSFSILDLKGLIEQHSASITIEKALGFECLPHSFLIIAVVVIDDDQRSIV